METLAKVYWHCRRHGLSRVPSAWYAVECAIRNHGKGKWV